MLLQQQKNLAVVGFEPLPPKDLNQPLRPLGHTTCVINIFLLFIIGIEHIGNPVIDHSL